jgi:DNA-binding IclR family transcriptional regulator
MHPSSTNQLLKTLVESGHLVFDARGKTYLPSPRLVGFGSWVTATYGAEDRFRTILQDIHTNTGAIVTLSAPNDLFMQILDVAGTADWAINARRGLHVSMFSSTALGNAYFSVISNKEIERLSERARLPRQTLPTLLKTISQVRQEGFAESISPDGHLRSMAIALPVPTPIPMVVAIADRAERVQNDRAVLQTEIRNAISRRAAAH